VSTHSRRPRSCTVRAWLGAIALALTASLSAAAEPPTTYYVNDACGNDTWTGTSPICAAPDGPKQTIQAAFNATAADDQVILADGIYTGPGNTNVAFPAHSISVKSENGQANCIIDCQSTSRAFIMQNNPSGSSSIRGLTIRNGSAVQGGAIFVDDGLLFLWDCLFTGGNALFGGAIYSFGGEVQAVDCVFIGNKANAIGGAIYSQGDLDLSGCGFISNSAVQSGGAVYAKGSQFARYSSCSFSGNTALELGGGLCIINGIDTKLTNCQFSDNQADVGGGVYNETSTGTVADCGFFDNRATRFGGAFTNSGSSPTITGCEFGRNQSGQGGGALASSSQSAPKVEGCRFFENTSLDGGAMFGFSNNGSTVTNCEFKENTATRFGGGIHSTASGPTVTNSTFSGNKAAQGGALSNVTNSTTNVRNSILWGNSPPEISDQSGSTTTALFSDVQGGWPGPTNMNVDPGFINPAVGDFRVGPGSPLIDAGANSIMPAGVTVDLDGNPRFVDDPNTPNTGLPGGGFAEIVDLGAFEVQGDACYADCDPSTGMGVLDVFDFLCFQNSFVLGEPYACDCDTSTAMGVCDVFDFLCFQNAFVGGCP
jgi:predicted outer membrane repeat protein